MDLESLAGAGGVVVRAAARYIREAFGQVGAGMAEEKAPNSLVSRVDREAERILVNGLSDILPQSVFLTEEETIPIGEGQWRWIVDPLDGTTNFLYGLPLFTVSVGLERDGRLVLGMVHDVMADQHFVAWEGGGAWRDGDRIRVSATPFLAGSLLATGFPYYDYTRSGPYLEVLGALMRKTRGIRRLGSAALDLAWTACGRFDTFYEYSLNAWDVAGGVVLVREAGGVVTDFGGGGDFLFGQTLIAGNPMVAPLVQLEISSYFSRV